MKSTASTTRYGKMRGSSAVRMLMLIAPATKPTTIRSIILCWSCMTAYGVVGAQNDGSLRRTSAALALGRLPASEGRHGVLRGRARQGHLRVLALADGVCSNGPLLR